MNFRTDSLPGSEPKPGRPAVDAYQYMNGIAVNDQSVASLAASFTDSTASSTFFPASSAGPFSQPMVATAKNEHSTNSTKIFFKFFIMSPFVPGRGLDSHECVERRSS